MVSSTLRSLFFFFNETAPTEIYTLSLHDALPISLRDVTKRYRTRHGHATVLDALDLSVHPGEKIGIVGRNGAGKRSEEHTSELQSLRHLVCRLLLEKKKKKKKKHHKKTQTTTDKL